MTKSDNIKKYYAKKWAVKQKSKTLNDPSRRAYSNCFARAPNFEGTYEEFKDHIEKQFEFLGFGWHNYGGWELDHIIPLAKGGPHCYKNLQVLSQHENRVKHASVSEANQSSD